MEKVQIYTFNFFFNFDGQILMQFFKEIFSPLE